jgi:hypothetical protein
MTKLKDSVFYHKIKEQTLNGVFDPFLTIPFMSRDLLIATFSEKLQRKIDTGGTAILTDVEIRECISETKEIAGIIVSIYMKFGFIEKTEEGYEFTKKGDLAIRASHIL